MKMNNIYVIIFNMNKELNWVQNNRFSLGPVFLIVFWNKFLSNTLENSMHISVKKNNLKKKKQKGKNKLRIIEGMETF